MQQKQQQKQAQQQAQQQAAKVDAATYFGKKRTDFYPSLKKLAKEAREPGPKRSAAQAQITAIDQRFQNDPSFHDEVTKRVRVKAKKLTNDARGVGLDELFQTSETMEWLKRSADMVPNVKPFSTVTFPKGPPVKITWLDAQENIRLPTSDVFTKAGEGHPGALVANPGDKGYMTKGSPELHQKRTALIMAQNTPLKAVRAALTTHLAWTPNVTEAQKVFNKGFDTHNNAIGTQQGKQDFIEYLARGRDYQKSITQEFYRASSPTTTSKAKHTLSPPKYTSGPKYEFDHLTQNISKRYNELRPKW